MKKCCGMCEFYTDGGDTWDSGFCCYYGKDVEAEQIECKSYVCIKIGGK